MKRTQRNYDSYTRERYPYEVWAKDSVSSKEGWVKCQGWVDLHVTFRNRLEFVPPP